MQILKWLVLTFVGTRGGQTSYGNVRHVFYSNSAAPLIRELIEQAADLVADDLAGLREDEDVKAALTSEHLSRRYERLLDIVDTG